jgi:hypothetical protein
MTEQRLILIYELILTPVSARRKIVRKHRPRTFHGYTEPSRLVADQQPPAPGEGRRLYVRPARQEVLRLP